MKRLSFFLFAAVAVFFCFHPVVVFASQSAPLTPFGSSLFQGNFAKTLSDKREIGPGDRILIRIWGDYSFDSILDVNDFGEVTLPGIGVLTVAGLPESQLKEALRSKLNVSGTASAEIYCRLLNAQPITVMVTGSVKTPGSYSGAASDSILAFLDRAGGIDPARGSYRNISLLRNGKEVSSFDLYPFLTRGELPPVRLRNDDTLVVREKGISVSASGESRNAAKFELRSGETKGEHLLALAEPLPRASHVGISGTRNNAPYNLYLSLRNFAATPLRDGDKIVFMADVPDDTIMVEVTGAIKGVSRFPLRKGARLSELRQYIAVDPAGADIASLYIKRKSVAVRQKKAIEDSLRRLEQSALTSPSTSTEETQMRVQEANMISAFAEKARKIEPEGIVVLGERGSVADLTLEDGDIIVIPEKSDVVMINGEVVVPQALIWSAKKDVGDYIKAAGGFTSRADASKILLIRPNGEVDINSETINPGDQLVVLPRFDSKNLQMVKDVTQILYQVAVATKMVLLF